MNEWNQFKDINKIEKRHSSLNDYWNVFIKKQLLECDVDGSV